MPKPLVHVLIWSHERWIAGLHLAALTLQKRADRAVYLDELTGSQRYLLDYVQEEILVRLPERVRDFLLHCAILSHLDATACQAVIAAPTRTASQQMLVFLERANLFVVPQDEERRTYRRLRLLHAEMACYEAMNDHLGAWAFKCSVSGDSGA